MSLTLLLAAIQLRATKSNIAQSSRNIVKKDAQGFATWMEDDLESMGRNINSGLTSPYNVPYDNPVDSAGITTSFTFRRDSVVTTESSLCVETRYKVNRVGSRMVEGESKDLYQLRRYQRHASKSCEKIGEGGMGWGPERQDGESAPALGYFDVELLNKNAQEVLNPYDESRTDTDTVRSVQVRFSMVAPFQNERTSLRVVHFGSVLLVRSSATTFDGGLGGDPTDDGSDDDGNDGSDGNDGNDGNDGSDGNDGNDGNDGGNDDDSGWWPPFWWI